MKLFRERLYILLILYLNVNIFSNSTQTNVQLSGIYVHDNASNSIFSWIEFFNVCLHKKNWLFLFFFKLFPIY